MPYTKKLNRKRTRSGKRTPARRMYRTMKKIANSAITKKAETKHVIFNAENTILSHNYQISQVVGGNDQPMTLQGFFDCWSKYITAGPNVNQRIGTEIQPRGMSIRLYLENDAQRPNVHYRIILGTAPKQLLDGTTTTYNNLQLMEGSGGNLVRHVNTEPGYKIFYDRVVKNEPGISTTFDVGNKRCHVFKKIWIKSKKGSKILFNAAEQGVVSRIQNKPFFCTVIPYDSYSTLATDNIASVNYQCKLYYKDL